MQKKSFFYFLSSYLFIYLLFLPKIGQNVKGFKLSNKYHIKIYTFKLTKVEIWQDDTDFSVNLNY